MPAGLEWSKNKFINFGLLYRDHTYTCLFFRISDVFRLEINSRLKLNHSSLMVHLPEYSLNLHQHLKINEYLSPNKN